MNIEPHHINYFNRAEFDRNGENWFDKCSPRLLVLLDTFRHLTGECIISPHPLAIGRRAYDKNPTSQHSVDTWREVRGIDVFPEITNFSSSGRKERDSAKWWIEKATQLGFGGCGLYPRWTLNGEQRCGLHLDCRDVPEIVTWSYYDNGFHSIEDGLLIL